MSIDRTPAHLADMLGFVRELRSIVADRTLQSYTSERVLNLAVDRLFINLGDAAQRVAEAERSSMSDVPWRQIIGLRKLLAHGYERVDQETLHRTVRTELAAVEQAIDAPLLSRGRR